MLLWRECCSVALWCCCWLMMWVIMYGVGDGGWCLVLEREDDVGG